MADFIIVGAGVSGLIAARILKSLGKEFIGLEREDRMGGRGETGHHRILSEKSVDYLRRWSNSEWASVNEDPKERKKGDWVQPEISEQENENFYLSSHFFQPKTSFGEVIKNLGEPVTENFQFRKTVDKVDSEKKLVLCQDGSEYPYKTLIWCAHLPLLRKAWIGSDVELLKSLKKSLTTYSGLNIDFTLAAPLFPYQNSVVFSFRFKDQKIRSIGIQDSFSSAQNNEDHNLHWILFLNEELTEDREEVAKVIRSFKRELQKEFPQFSQSIRHEKITFLPALSGDEPVSLKTLEVSKDVLYLGPQARLKDEAEDESKLINIDRTILNCRAFEQTFASAQTELSS